MRPLRLGHGDTPRTARRLRDRADEARADPRRGPEPLRRNRSRRTSLARVAKDAGITDAELLHHFRDKQQLLLAVVEHWFQRQDERSTQCLSLRRRQGRLPQLPAGHRGQPARPGMIELEVVLAAEAISPDHPAHALFSGWQESGVRRLAANLRAGSSPANSSRARTTWPWPASASRSTRASGFSGWRAGGRSTSSALCACTSTGSCATSPPTAKGCSRLPEAQWEVFILKLQVTGLA